MRTSSAAAALLLVASSASAGPPVAKLGDFQLWQKNCEKTGCETWIQSGEARADIGALEGKIWPLKPVEASETSRSHQIPGTQDEKTLGWCDEGNCDSEQNFAQITLGLVDLDPKTKGLLVTTSEGFETIYYHWKLYIADGKALKSVLEGKSGRHSPPTIGGEWGFTTTGKSLGYYFLSYYWEFLDAQEDTDFPDLHNQFFSYETQRWNAAKKAFEPAKSDPIPLWALLGASGKSRSGVQKEAQALSKALEPCQLQYRLTLMNAKPFKKLTPGTWIFATFSTDKAELEREASALKKCTRTAQPLVKQAL